jgi:hypothetical protein
VYCVIGTTVLHANVVMSRDSSQNKNTFIPYHHHHHHHQYHPHRPWHSHPLGSPFIPSACTPESPPAGDCYLHIPLLKTGAVDHQCSVISLPTCRVEARLSQCESDAARGILARPREYGVHTYYHIVRSGSSSSNSLGGCRAKPTRTALHIYSMAALQPLGSTSRFSSSF